MQELKDIIAFSGQVADRLIMQYGEYVFLSAKIKGLEDEKFRMILAIAKERSIGVQDALKQEADGMLKRMNEIIALYRIDLERVSDEMTFPNPLIWMTYKYKAYKGTSSEIATMGDFRRHCAPAGYICTARFGFMRDYMEDKNRININDKARYPDEIKLPDFYLSKEAVGLLADTDFMSEWKRREYLITENKINKWNASH